MPRTGYVFYFACTCRCYLEHVREAFGDRGPPPAFPAPAGQRVEAFRRRQRGDGGLSSPSLLRVCVGDVSAGVTPPTSGEALCRGLLVREGGVVFVWFCISDCSCMFWGFHHRGREVP